jgi:hypothetical protein
LPRTAAPQQLSSSQNAATANSAAKVNVAQQPAATTSHFGTQYMSYLYIHTTKCILFSLFFYFRSNVVVVEKEILKIFGFFVLKKPHSHTHENKILTIVSTATSASSSSASSVATSSSRVENVRCLLM